MSIRRCSRCGKTRARPTDPSTPSPCHEFHSPTPHGANLRCVCACRPLQSKVQSCERCRDLFSSAGSLQAASPSRHKTSTEPLDEEKDELKVQLRQLELELAQTKLQLVEAECKIQVRCPPPQSTPSVLCG